MLKCKFLFLRLCFIWVEIIVIGRNLTDKPPPPIPIFYWRSLWYNLFGFKKISCKNGGHGTSMVLLGDHGTSMVLPGGHDTSMVLPGGHGTSMVLPRGHGTSMVLPGGMVLRDTQTHGTSMVLPGVHGTSMVLPGGHGTAGCSNSLYFNGTPRGP